ncbi:hypothetical protein [Hyphomicrobium sp. CS1BSMeth3]|uniref:hypothetical protein n=1 Tax=Hyphomicrobium sp. CS1BSMeth3 TaxID=1892844 RepID=UPI001FCD5354|nr:hypothetical protein [Hyphomicrobium sp. CS1BSMeth3]
MQNEWFFKWHFIGREGPVEIDSFDGRMIKYGGIKFSGTAHDIYWQTIQRYLRKKISAILDDVETELRKYPLEIRETTLNRARSLILQFAGKIRRAAIDKDRVLRGDGIKFPEARDFGQWSGSRNEDIEARIASLLDIYCDRKITIEGVEVSFNSMMNDKLTLVKADGTIVRENIPGQVTPTLVITFLRDLPIEPGDHFLRQLPSGLVDDLVVVDPGYRSGIGGIQAHFQTKVRRSDAATGSQHALIQNITNNFHGPNARVNSNSIDNSLNVAGDISVRDLSDFIGQLRPTIDALPSPQKELITAPLAILDEEIRASAPSQSRMRAALLSMKTIAEGVAGNLAAAGIVSLIGRLLSSA